MKGSCSVHHLDKNMKTMLSTRNSFNLILSLGQRYDSIGNSLRKNVRIVAGACATVWRKEERDLCLDLDFIDVSLIELVIEVVVVVCNICLEVGTALGCNWLMCLLTILVDIIDNGLFNEILAWNA
jgi:hypothetical protein